MDKEATQENETEQQRVASDRTEDLRRPSAEQVELFFEGLLSPAGEKPLRCTMRLAHPPKDMQPGDGKREWLGGTAVAVKCGGKHWLLTAAHCLHERKRSHETLGEMTFYMVTARARPTSGCIGQVLSGGAAIIHGGKNTDNREGPDIAWIAIDEEKADWIKNQTFGLFYNLDKERGGGPATGHIFVCGFVGEDDATTEAHGTAVLCNRMWPVYPTEIRTDGEAFSWEIEESNGWQYRDMIVDSPELSKNAERHHDPEYANATPEYLRKARHEDLKGMSGAGLWMCFKTEDAEDIDWHLLGIAYYQDERLPNGRKLVRFHGIHSIAEKIREQGHQK